MQGYQEKQGRIAIREAAKWKVKISI